MTAYKFTSADKTAMNLPLHVHHAILSCEGRAKLIADRLRLMRFYRKVAYHDGNLVIVLNTLGKNDPETGMCAVSFADPDELRTGSWRKDFDKIVEEALVRVSLGLQAQ